MQQIRANEKQGPEQGEQWIKDDQERDDDAWLGTDVGEAVLQCLPEIF